MLRVGKNTLLGIAMIVTGAGLAMAQTLDVPVIVTANEDLDTCAVGEVHGLNPNGDNFLAVRAGPGSDHAMIDKVHTGDQVWMFSQRGKWIGIVYASAEINCSPITKDKVYDGPGRKGWVYDKYIKVIAG